MATPSSTIDQPDAQAKRASTETHTTPPIATKHLWRYARLMQVVTDHYMAELSRAELAVLHYIIRRTAGFGKERDAIGYPQFMEGITKQDGTVLDRGTGIKDRNTLARALASLEARGLIAQHAHRGVGGGGSQYADYRVLIDTDESRDSSATKVGKIPTVVPGDESMDYPATKVGKIPTPSKGSPQGRRAAASRPAYGPCYGASGGPRPGKKEQSAPTNTMQQRSNLCYQSVPSTLRCQQRIWNAPSASTPTSWD